MRIPSPARAFCNAPGPLRIGDALPEVLLGIRGAGRASRLVHILDGVEAFVPPSPLVDSPLLLCGESLMLPIDHQNRGSASALPADGDELIETHGASLPPPCAATLTWASVPENTLTELRRKVRRFRLAPGRA
jgi:hypothetical protein